MNNDTLYIIIPAYNEEENIEAVIEEWYPIIEEYNGNGNSRLVIINDGSTDSTPQIIRKCKVGRPLLELITRNNSGHGATVLFGYKYAINSGADYIFQTDSDGQTLATEFSPFWEQRKQYDMIIGWRKSRKDGISRIIVTRVLKIVIFLCFGVYIKDANTPYRLMSTTTLRQYIEMIPTDYSLSNVIISVIYKKRDCSVKYIPITFNNRRKGVNSINFQKILPIGLQALKDFRKINKELKN